MQITTTLTTSLIYARCLSARIFSRSIIALLCESHLNARRYEGREMLSFLLYLSQASDGSCWYVERSIFSPAPWAWINPSWSVAHFSWFSPASASLGTYGFDLSYCTDTTGINKSSYPLTCGKVTIDQPHMAIDWVIITYMERNNEIERGSRAEIVGK